MSPKLLLHIGPPKTATTSLQIALRNIADERFSFGGSLYPREQNTGSLCYKLLKACSGASVSQLETDSIRTEIQALLVSRSTLFFSEELFLVEEPDASISTKLHRLSEIMLPFDCRIILTLRRARDALPSWYQESLKNPTIPKVAFRSFCDSARAACFDYSAICHQLKQLGFRDIRLLEFETLTSANVSLGYVSGDSRWDHERLFLPHANKGRFHQHSTDRILPSLTLKAALSVKLNSMAFFRYVDSKLGLRKWYGFQTLKSVTEGLSWRQEQHEELLVPENVLRRFDDSYDRALEFFGQHELAKGSDNSD